jgi:T5SS/PEP-CTERM-associated repeat protein
MKRSHTLPATLAAWPIAFALCGAPASAALIFWTGGETGSFQSAANWSSGSVPGPADLAIFSDVFAGADDVTVSFAASVTNEGLGVGGLALTLELSGFSYTLTDALTVSTGAEFTIKGGTLSAETAVFDLGAHTTVANDAILATGTTIVGGSANSSATIDVDGTWNNEMSLILGNAGGGTLNVGHDGTDSTGTGGTVTTSVLLLGSGNGGQGTINLGEGATLESDVATLGPGNGSSGTVNVGEDAAWINHGAIIAGALGASGGSGTINVDDGGQLRTESMSVGNNGLVSSAGAGAIVVADTSINFSSLNQTIQNRINGGGLFVASNGLVIANGGVVEATRAFIDSFSAGGTGTATVTGSGSRLDLGGGGLHVGGFHGGSLNIAGGGRVESGNAVIADVGNSNGMVNIAGRDSGGNASRWIVGGSMLVGDRGTASMTISGGGLLESGNATIGNRPSGSGAVTVLGQDADGNASLWDIDGMLTVGKEGSGELAVTAGARVNASGDGEIGATEGGTGTVFVTGIGANQAASVLDLGGDLTLGFAPSAPGAVPLNAVNAMLIVTNSGVVVLNQGAGTLTINGSGMLSGNSAIDGSVQLFGRISPDGPDGTLRITGDFETNEGSVIQVQYSNQQVDLAEVFPNLDPTLVENLLSSGLIAVEGQATLADGTIVNLVKVTGTATPGDAIIIVHSEMGGMDPSSPPDLSVQGSFLVQWVQDVIQSNGESFLRLIAEVDEPGLEDFLTGLTGNVKNVADALAAGELFDVLTQLDPDDPDSGLRTLLPLHHHSAATQNIRASQLFNTSFLQEMAGLRAGVRAGDLIGGPQPRMFSLSPHDPGSIEQRVRMIDTISESVALAALPPEVAGTWGGFIGGMGIWDRVSTSRDRVGHRAHAWGVHGGVHHHLTRDLLLGVSAGYVSTDLNFRNGFGEGTIETFRAGPYVSWTPGGGDFFVDGAATYGYHRNKIDRATITGTARSRYDAHDISVLGQAGYDFGIFKRTVLTPLLGVEYVHLRTDSFRESGAGSANLDVNSMTTDSLRVRLGGKLAHALEFDELTLVPEIFAGFAYEFLDTDADIRSRFIAGGPSFTTRSQGVGRESLQVSAGFTAMAGTYITLFVRYEGEFQSGRTSHGVIGGLDIRF